MYKGPEAFSNCDTFREEVVAAQEVLFEKEQKNEGQREPIKILYIPGKETENDSIGKGESPNYFKEIKQVILFVIQRNRFWRGLVKKGRDWGQEDHQNLQ